MQLKRLSYTGSTWELEGIRFLEQNLIVGQNGTGKSRTLYTIETLAKLLGQRFDSLPIGEWEVHFLDDENREYHLSFAIRALGAGIKREVTSERWAIDGQQVLLRDSLAGTAFLWNQQAQKNEIVHPPAGKLTLHTNRDMVKYPWFETVAVWADNSFGFRFGNLIPEIHLSTQEYGMMKAVKETASLFQQLNEATREQVLTDFNALGYALSKIYTIEQFGDIALMVEERGVAYPLYQYQLSQGMFRALVLIIYLHSLASYDKPATVIIDDLCEGLDYSRATRLGKWVFEKCSKNHIQLIATSNDNFLMEVVDLDYWNILFREGKTVRTINKASHPALFEQFRYTGLSNFDFFASDFIANRLHEENGPVR